MMRTFLREGKGVEFGRPRKNEKQSKQSEENREKREREFLNEEAAERATIHIKKSESNLREY